MRFQLYYWSGIQGRGEFVRLALEDAGANYVDVAREKGDKAIQPYLKGRQGDMPPFAPPFLKAGRTLVSQTAAILQFLAPRLKLLPEGAAARRQAHELQLTIADVVSEIHDTHHPIASGAYYEDQREAAAARSKHFRAERLPKFLGYFDKVVTRGGGTHALSAHSYVDLSLFQLVSGLDYAFPRAMHGIERDIPALRALARRVAERPSIARYLDSPRRLAFNEQGIFRHYPELDAS